VAFNRDGTRFVSCGYDKMIRLWDTETGECLATYTNKRIPFCVKFHPNEDKAHLFVSGMADKKILCWDTTTGEIVQEYDRLAPFSHSCLPQLCSSRAYYALLVRIIVASMVLMSQTPSRLDDSFPTPPYRCHF